MSLISKIQTLIETAYPDATFILSSRFNANLDSFSVIPDDLPLIILNNELNLEGELYKNNNIGLNRRIVITFLDLDNAENNDLASEIIRSSMESYAVKIASLIWQLPEVIPSGNQKFKITPEFHVFNTNLTGVLLDMSVNENTIINICAV